MASIAEINIRVARHLNTKEGVVAQYSRQLINTGLLPKSSGKAIADVHPKHLIRIILAVGLGGKYIEAAEKVETYLALKNGVPHSESDASIETAEDRLLYSFFSVTVPKDAAPREVSGHRQAERSLRYEFIKDWPRIFIHEDGMIVEDFAGAEADEGQFEADAYSSFSLSCSFFDHYQDLAEAVSAEEWGVYLQKLDE